jgi:hypothetical protein
MKIGTLLLGCLLLLSSHTFSADEYLLYNQFRIVKSGQDINLEVISVSQWAIGYSEDLKNWYYFTSNEDNREIAYYIYQLNTHDYPKVFFRLVDIGGPIWVRDIPGVTK